MNEQNHWLTVYRSVISIKRSSEVHKRLIRDNGHRLWPLLCRVMSYTETYAFGPLVKSLYLSEKASDITLVVDGHPIRAHKFVLSAKSIVFKKMFFGDFSEANAKEVVIRNTNLDALKMLLKFCYNEDLSANDWPPNDHNLVIEVYKISHLYQIKGLCFLCVKRLITLLSEHNLKDISSFVRLYPSKRLLFFIKKFIKHSKKGSKKTK